MDRYAVFLDIDGTLTSGGTVPQKNIEAIKLAQSKGHYVFYNTGRSFGYIPECCRKSLTLDGFVAGIGSHVVCGDTVLKRETLSPDEVYEIFRYYLPKKREVIMEGEDESICCCPSVERPVTNELTDAREVYTKYSSLALTKGFFGGVLPQAEQEAFAAAYNFFQHPNYAEFSKKGCTKSDGMRLILEHLDIPAERCVAMGDSLNDVDMLNFAGISVAMQNAPDYIKEMCSFVTLSNNDAGVAHAIARLLPGCES